MGPAWAAMEAFNRNLSAEFGSYGICAVCLRSTGLPETHTIEVVFGLHAKAMGIPQEAFLKFVESMTHRKRSSTLAAVADAAVFLASDRASGMTGTVANLTGGMIVETSNQGGTKGREKMYLLRETERSFRAGCVNPRADADGQSSGQRCMPLLQADVAPDRSSLCK
jgi:hypothetical protein